MVSPVGLLQLHFHTEILILLFLKKRQKNISPKFNIVLLFTPSYLYVEFTYEFSQFYSLIDSNFYLHENWKCSRLIDVYPWNELFLSLNLSFSTFARSCYHHDIMFVVIHVTLVGSLLVYFELTLKTYDSTLSLYVVFVLCGMTFLF